MPKIGYYHIDKLSEDDLILMYLQEGKSYREAKRLAKTLCSEIAKMDGQEKRLWRKVRKNEKTGIIGEP